MRYGKLAMSMYNKLFTKILDSSIWLEDEATRIVWVTMLAVMDEDGYCQFASAANVAHRARVSVEAAERALACLESPDEHSSDPENEGRRIERVGGGWVVLNANKYRTLVTRAIIRERTRERVARHRAKKRTCNAPVTPSVSVSEARSEAEAESVKTRTRATSAGPLAGSLPRDHIDHGFCGSRFCVTSKTLLDMARRYGDGGEAAVQAWLQRLNDGLGAHESPGGPVWVLRQFDAFLEAQGRLRKPVAPIDDWKARARAAGGAKK
jgi:hypothetical protein